MKILESIQLEFLELGICLHMKATQTRQFNSRNVFILIVICCGTISTCVDLIFTPKNFKEYTVSAYAVSAMLITTICFVGLIWQMPLMSRYLACFEETINNSELTFIGFRFKR